MTVADLHEAESAHLQAVPHHPAARGLLDRHPLQDAARHRPHGAGADPRHALQEPATIRLPFIVLLRHRLRLLAGQNTACVTHGVLASGLGYPDRRGGTYIPRWCGGDPGIKRMWTESQEKTMPHRCFEEVVLQALIPGKAGLPA